eukprot:2482819-Ditylum_brightwellii.AAC.1
MAQKNSEDDYYGYDDGCAVILIPSKGSIKAPQYFCPFQSYCGLGGEDPAPDTIVTTPASLGPLVYSPKNIDLSANVQILIIDEADMLLDGGYIQQLEN